MRVQTIQTVQTGARSDNSDNSDRSDRSEYVGFRLNSDRSERPSLFTVSRLSRPEAKAKAELTQEWKYRKIPNSSAPNFY